MPPNAIPAPIPASAQSSPPRTSTTGLDRTGATWTPPGCSVDAAAAQPWLQAGARTAPSTRAAQAWLQAGARTAPSTRRLDRGSRREPELLDAAACSTVAPGGSPNCRAPRLSRGPGGARAAPSSPRPPMW